MTQYANILSLNVGTITSGGGGQLFVNQIAASLGNISNIVSQNANIQQLAAQTSSISNLSTQYANIVNLNVGTITSGGGGQLFVNQIAASAGNISNLIAQNANVQQLVAQVSSLTNASIINLTANTSNLNVVTVGNSLVAPLANITSLYAATHTGGQFIGNSGTFSQVTAQLSSLGNVLGPLTVSGDIIFTGNLKQTMFANAPGGGLPSYTFANVSAGNLVVTSQANINSLGASTIFCSNIVGYTAGGGIANTQNITGNSASYQSVTANALQVNTSFVMQNQSPSVYLGPSLTNQQSGFINFNLPQYAPGTANGVGIGVFGTPVGISIAPNGNVGVANPNPQAALDVGGGIKALTANIGALTVVGNTYLFSMDRATTRLAIPILPNNCSSLQTVVVMPMPLGRGTTQEQVRRTASTSTPGSRVTVCSMLQIILLCP